jgi:peptidoglycan/LPS O-acetylase OafA/YrhL
MPLDTQPLYGLFSVFYLNGWHMVDLFFVLSGVVFSYVYGKRIRQAGITAREYSVHRFSRLYPLHVGTLIFTAILFLYSVNRGYGLFVYPASNLRYFAANILFIQSGVTPWPWTFNGPVWSISCEVVAYILFFVLMKYFYDRRVVISIVLILTGITFRHLHANSYLINQDIGRLLEGFFTGVLVYETLFSWKLNARQIYLIVLSLLLAFSISIYIRPSAWSYPGALFLYPALIIASIKVSFINKALSWRPLAYLGDISYSVYMLHFPVQLALHTFAKQLNINLPYTTAGFLGIYALLVVSVSILSYEFFEKPVQTSLRKRLLSH